MDVAPATLAALDDAHAFAIAIEVGDDLMGFLIAYYGADGHAQFQVHASLAVAVRAHAMFAMLGAENARVAILDECVEVTVSDHPDAATTAAVAAVGATLGNVFFASERDAAIAAIAGDDFDAGFVKEFHGGVLATERFDGA